MLVMAKEKDELRNELKRLGVARIARESGVHQNTLQDYARGDTYELRPENAGRVRNAIKKITQEESPDAADGLPAKFAMHGGVELVGQPYTLIPVYDLSASAGAGSLVEDGEAVGFEAFRAGELRRITKAEYENLSIIKVSGDSMAPFLNSGDRVMVDRGITRVRKDGIYVLDLEGELMIKRCQVEIDTGHIHVRSDNPDWPSQKVTKPDRMRVVGRACWMARALI